ncbi:KUP/HAK/KT family potassium transporter [Rhodotorula paludigena]|uniref:KUP/HAK/KT family potassium transporter n=1 Tax=Rhodotorula paludigena TaxID=86838 RepID=UPI00317DEA0C
MSSRARHSATGNNDFQAMPGLSPQDVLEGEIVPQTLAARPPPSPPTASVAPTISMRQTLKLAFLSVGVIYGDIGTSTLYTVNGLFPAAGPVPSREDVIGGISCILWAILLVPIVKYCFIALEFGTTQGEGGPFAIYTSIFPPRESKQDGWRTLTTYSLATAPPSSHAATSFLHRRIVKTVLFVLTLFGVALTVSDGMLTPAVSVTSAVTGISYAAPSVSGSVVGISCAILAVLFLVQPFGTKRLGTFFSPVVGVWLLTNAVSGVINLTQHPSIFRAFDPSRAVMLFVRTRNFDLLAGVILCITGVEALFANLGQFSKGSIRLAFVCFAAPCLMLQYLGQGARLIVDGEAILPNVFYNSIPGGTGGGFWWFTWVFAVLSAVIASQAMITATFSLVEQLTQLHVMPPVRVVHTDSTSRGRIYVPMINFLLFVGTIGLTCGFGTDVGLTNAYGFAVSGVMLITTLMIALAMIQLKGFPVLVALAYFFLAAFIDCLFFGASLKKVPHGAWFPLGLAIVILAALTSWAWARGLEEKFDRLHRYRLSELMRPKLEDEDDQETRDEKHPEQDIAEVNALGLAPQGGFVRRKPALQGAGGADLNRLPVFALFHNHSSSSSEGAPHAFSAFLRSYPALPQVIVFLTVRVVGVPYVAFEDRFLVERLRQFDGVYVATVSFGYRDAQDLSDIAPPLRDRIVALEARSYPHDEAFRDKIAKVDEAVKGAVTHILPHFHVSADDSPTRSKVVRLVRKFLLEEVYRRVAVNFDPYEQFKFANEEDVLRMGVAAVL